MRQFLGRGTAGERGADIIRLNVSGVVLETCSGNILLVFTFPKASQQPRMSIEVRVARSFSIPTVPHPKSQTDFSASKEEVAVQTEFHLHTRRRGASHAFPTQYHSDPSLAMKTKRLSEYIELRRLFSTGLLESSLQARRPSDQPCFLRVSPSWQPNLGRPGPVLYSAGALRCQTGNRPNTIQQTAASSVKRHVHFRVLS